MIAKTHTQRLTQNIICVKCIITHPGSFQKMGGWGYPFGLCWPLLLGVLPQSIISPGLRTDNLGATGARFEKENPACLYPALWIRRNLRTTRNALRSITN